MKNSGFSLLKTGNDAVVSQVVDKPSPAVDEVAWRFWGMWVLIALVALYIQLLTLDVLPAIKQDEAQITEYGRLTLNPHSDWSINWWIEAGKPLFIWSYLGPLIAEVSFQLGGPSGLGPRLAALVGGFMAATMALGWLLARRVPVYAAFGLSLAFMLDPLFVLSQRMARVDSWVIGFCLASCWLLRRETSSKHGFFAQWRLMAAGGCAAAAAFIWPSAVLLYPLIILELYHKAGAEKAAGRKASFIGSLVFYFGLGGLLAAVLLLLPIWQHLVLIFNDMSTMVTQNVDSSKSFQDRLFSLFNVEHWKRIFRAFRRTFSPLFPLLAFAGALLYREKGLILALTVALYIIFASLVYELRVLYLLPYLLALSSGIFMYAAAKRSNLLLKKISLIALGVLLTWSVGISLIIRTALGLDGKTELDRSKIFQVASSAIGSGNHKVFLAYTYEFYFVGRSLGWKLYAPYMQYAFNDQGTWTREDFKPADKFQDLFSKMDYAIFSKGTLTREVEKQMARSGLYYSHTIRVGPDQYPKKTMEFLLWLLQGRVGFLQGKDSYGSFLLYARNLNGNQHSVPLNQENRSIGDESGR